MNKEEGLVEGIFQKHHAYYDTNGVETIKQQASQYRQVSDAYQGRLLFELLQNAIDKADAKILVSLEEVEGKLYLLVANDGERFTYDSVYNYKYGNKGKRRDFQSLCSIATSTKDAARYLGNKGVGFKSVFSISPYAIIYSQGIVIASEEEIKQNIDFRIYDLFTSQEELKSLGLEKAAAKLASIQSENSRWGIPGYYYPVRERNRPERITHLMKEGYVTVVAVPLEEEKRGWILDKIREIEKFQFHFVCVKRPAAENITILFEAETVSFYKVLSSDKRVVSRCISGETRQLAEKAGLIIGEEAKVSVYFKSKEEIEKHYEGYVYNFMPLEKRFVFSFLDINADFQTSVDRKAISLSATENIGKYNRALLKECLALCRDALKDQTLLPTADFLWEYIKLVDDWGAEDQEKAILKEVFHEEFSLGQYAVDLLTDRGTPDNKEVFDIFYGSFLLRCIRYFHRYNEPYFYCKDIAQKVGSSLRSSGQKFLPDIDCGFNETLFYREKANLFVLPMQIKAKITGCKLDDYAYGDELKKGLGIKDFEDFNEIYRLYRQCGYDGAYLSCEEGQLSEEEQIKILASVGKMVWMQKQREQERISSVWRLSHAIAICERGSDADTKLWGGFALSTLFYKTKDGKYKPAQLLRKCDIDEGFLHAIVNEIDISDYKIEDLLLKTGVSFSSNYIYADQRIWKAIPEGLDFIPCLWTGRNPPFKEAIKNIAIVDKGGQAFHPAIVNENYSFLIHHIRRDKSNQAELNSLGVGAYDRFPQEYVDILKNSLKNYVCNRKEHAEGYKKRELMAFYQKYFKSFWSKGLFLVWEKNIFRVVGTDNDFLIVSDDSIFWADAFNRPVLCYTVGEKDKLPPDLQHRFRRLVISFDDENSEDICEENRLKVSDLVKDEEKQAKLLWKVSQSKLSDLDFEDNVEKRNEVFRRFDRLELIAQTTLCGWCEVDEERFLLHGLPFLRVEGSQTERLYIEVKENDPKSRNNVAKALALTVFHSENLTDVIEHVLFSDCWVDTDEVNKMLSYRVEYDESEAVFPVSEDKLTVEKNVWKEVPVYEWLDKNSSGTMEPFASSCGAKNSVSSGRRGVGEHEKMIGDKGERIVVKTIVQKFMKEYQSVKERRQAVERINEYLRTNGFQEIVVENNTFRTFEEIVNLLWYTSYYKYAHFDVVTLEKDVVKLIEVKSSFNNDSFRLSKSEAKVALGRPDNYSLCRVLLGEKRIIDFHNPFAKQKSFRFEGLIITPAGYDIREYNNEPKSPLEIRHS